MNPTDNVSVVGNTSNVNYELDIPCDHYTMAVKLKSEKVRSESRILSLKIRLIGQK